MALLPRTAVTEGHKDYPVQQEQLQQWNRYLVALLEYLYFSDDAKGEYFYSDEEKARLVVNGFRRFTAIFKLFEVSWVSFLAWISAFRPPNNAELFATVREEALRVCPNSILLRILGPQQHCQDLPVELGYTGKMRVFAQRAHLREEKKEFRKIGKEAEASRCVEWSVYQCWIDIERFGMTENAEFIRTILRRCG